jgi:hypothetical protein
LRIFAAVRSLLLPLLLALPAVFHGQDRILLMNGQTIETRVLGQSSLEVRYRVKKGDRLLERSEPTESVFSVTDSLGRERVWYFQDTLFGNDFSVNEMRWFIKGEQDARRGYRPLVPMLGGFVGSAGLVMGLDLEVIAIPLPMVYAGIMALPRVKVTKGSLSDPLLEGDDFYAYGYARAGKGRRVIRCLLSSALGVGFGLAVRQLIINPALDQ